MKGGERARRFGACRCYPCCCGSDTLDCFQVIDVQAVLCEPERKGCYAHVSGGGVFATSNYCRRRSRLVPLDISFFPSWAEIVVCAG